MFHVDEGPQHQAMGASASRADGQLPHLGREATVERLDSDDSFTGLQVPAYPS
jgi:hypothetical protein